MHGVIRSTWILLYLDLPEIKLIIHTEKSARESLPCVRGGAERSEAEGLLETEEALINLDS